MKTSILSLMIICTAVGAVRAAAQVNTNPVANFKYLWITLDKHYGNFLPKLVDWNAVYKVFRPMVNPGTTDEQLQDIFRDMLGLLNDNHVILRADRKNYGMGILDESAKTVDEIVEYFKDCTGLIIDVRMNTGGSDRAGSIAHTSLFRQCGG